MSLALEHFRALEEEHPLPQRLPADKAAGELTKLLADTQQLTLSQITSSPARQLGSILFSHEAGLVSALSTVNAPVVKKNARQVFCLNLLFLALACLAAVGAISLFGSDDIPACVFVIASICLAVAAYFVPRRDSEFQVEQTVDMKALLSLTERRMEALDRDLDAFLSVPMESGKSDDAVVNIITLAGTLKKQDPDSVPDELMTAITALSIANGYEFLDFNEETEPYFDTMPTKRETRTIVPAVLKNGAVIARGMAIVGLAPSQEENG